MNSSQRSSLDFSGTSLEEFSSDALLEVMQEKTDEESASKYVIIKHDFYSSDSDHGRDLLSGFISSLIESSFDSLIIYLIDKGTRLLDVSNPLYDDMQRLIQKSEIVIVDEDSLDEYNIRINCSAKLIKRSTKAIAEELIYSPGITVLE